MRRKIILVLMLLACLLASCRKPGQEAVILSPAGACLQERLAASELRRYLYARTGALVPIATLDSLPAGKESGILIAVKGRPLPASVIDEPTKKAVEALGDEEFLIKTITSPGRTLVVIAGGGAIGALYGAYRYIEEGLGVRFYLHGDVIPEGRMPFRIPEVNLRDKPLFRLRGIQPFHDFPEGPDWWNVEEYKAVLAQLPKLGMNFIGLHTYPEGNPNAEPTVWIGRPAAVGQEGQVLAGYPSSWQNTLRGNWGYEAKKTGDFPYGADQLFEADEYGAEIMKGVMPEPKTPEDATALFDRAGRMLGDVFGFAARLGIKTCLGTETPLTVPAWIQNGLRADGMSPQDPKVVKELYKGMFERLTKVSKPDYYWFWTTESWTWSDATRVQVKAVVDDLGLALQAAKELNVPFGLATCGWVLGPPSDRILFDRVLPKDVSLSCINREVGKAPVDTSFARIGGRSKWAIPWLEDDPSLTSPQLWAGRMRRDAADALAYGCDGLLGIHWRTRILSPNIKALARAAWEQKAWNPEPVDLATMTGPLNGIYASVPEAKLGDSPGDAVYRDVRDKVFGYYLPVPNGRYAVTLKFIDGQSEKVGQRVFDVFIEGKKALERIDLVEAAGRNTKLDFSFMNIVVGDGRLDIDFADRIGYPCLAALVVKGPGFVKKINCGGPAVGDYEADWPERPRFAPVDDLYADWARNQFGESAGPAIGALFAKIDGRLRIPVDWVGGPGGLRPDPRAWTEAAKDYAFVDELEALRPGVQGAGNLDRFDYWLHSFRYTREVAHLDCLAAEYGKASEEAKKLADETARTRAAAETLLPLRTKIIARVKAVFDELLPTVGTTGELGTVANWSQHILPPLLEKPGEELETMLGRKLPAEARLGHAYSGTPRIFVLPRPTALGPGETLKVKVGVLAQSKPDAIDLMWRKLGQGKFEKATLEFVARGVYQAKLANLRDDIEYYAVAKFGKEKLVFPPTAPELNETLVILK
jgi:hypothetical protein